ncbi:nucleoside-diphosphate kinase [Nanoarchaeota archaeon]
MALELTLTFIKPDSMVSSLVGEITTAFSQADLKHAGSRLVRPSRQHVAEHYKSVYDGYRKKHGVDPPFVEALETYIMGIQHYPDDPDSRRVEILAYYGENAIMKIKSLAGPTFPPVAKREAPTSIRGKFSYLEPVREPDRRFIIDGKGDLVYHIWNCVHASDNEGAEREVKLWMRPTDIVAPEWRVFGVVTSEDHFYFNPQTGNVTKTHRPGSRTIVAPGDQVWESDFKNLLQYRDGRGTPTQSLNSVILKYDVIPHEMLTWE